jgi:hypothetical protein
MDHTGNGNSSIQLLHPPPNTKMIFSDFWWAVNRPTHHAINPTHHTIVPILLFPAATSMMMIVECFEPNNHSYFPAVCCAM